MGRAFATHKAEHIGGQGEQAVRKRLRVSVDEVIEDIGFLISSPHASGRAAAQRTLSRRGGEGQLGNTASGRKPPRRHRPFPLSRTVEVEPA